MKVINKILFGIGLIILFPLTIILYIAIHTVNEGIDEFYN